MRTLGLVLLVIAVFGYLAPGFRDLVPFQATASELRTFAGIAALAGVVLIGFSFTR